MKNLISLFLIVVSVTIVSCTEPEITRYSMGGEITMAEIDKYVKVSVENGNTLVMNADGLQALSMFDYGQGVLRGTGGTVLLLNKGVHTIKYTARCANGKELTKDFQITVNELKNVDLWINLCGENGTKTWTWSDQIPVSTSPGWTPEPGGNYFPVGPVTPGNPPVIQQYPAAGQYATAFGLGVWRVHTYPQLHQLVNTVSGDEFYSATLKPLPSGYLNADWNIRDLATSITAPADEGVILDAAGGIEKIATMTFSVVNGFTFSKTRINSANTTVTSAFRVDPAGGRQSFDVPGEVPSSMINDFKAMPNTNNASVRWYDKIWAEGQLIITNQSVLCGGTNYTYNIVKLTADEMVLAVRAGGSWPNASSWPTANRPYRTVNNDNIRCYMWVFKPYTP